MTNHKSFSLALVRGAFVALVGCADVDSSDLASSDAAAATDDGAGARSSNSPVYLQVRQDVRRCASPMCGGLFVKRANFATTKCADGVYREECYVAQASYGALHFNEGERAYVDGRVRAGFAIVKGNVVAKNYASFGNLGQLNVTEAWDSWTDQPATGTLHTIASTGIVCVKAPCPTLHATELNRSKDVQITDLDLATLNMAEETKGDVLNVAYTDSLLAAGDITTCDDSVVLHTSQVFKKIEHKLVIDLEGDWRFVRSDKSRYTYTFNTDGTFRAMQEPGCLFSNPRCAIKMALLEGTFAVDGTKLHIVYTSPVRNGETADFVITGEGSAQRITGDDFGQTLKLKKI
jgi:hypothetical protein